MEKIKTWAQFKKKLKILKELKVEI